MSFLKLRPWVRVIQRGIATEEQRIRPQLNTAYYAQHADRIAVDMKQRNYDPAVIFQVRDLVAQKKQLEDEAEGMRMERDKVNQQIRSASKSERPALISAAKEWKEQLRVKEEGLIGLENDLTNKALLVPNDTHPECPVGPESNARIIKVVGEPKTEAWHVDHVALAERMDMVDFEQAALITGSKFYYLKNAGAWLELALIQYAMHKAAAHGFSPVLTPDIVRTSVAYGCGFQPRKNEASQIYDVSTASTSASAPKMCLVGTAEIPLAGLYAQKTLQEEELPKKMVGFSHAYRAEAGHGSAEERGLYRVHQFSKVELFTVTTPAQSEQMLQDLRVLQEEIFTDLELCFRILDMPTEELGASAYRKYDMEAWMPGKQGWGEISSTSNCTDYQSRRLNIRYVQSEFKEQAKQKEVRVPWHIKEKWVHYCHTLNGTAMAIPRIIIALLETHQQEDGTVKVPIALRPFIPGQPSLLQ